MCMKSGKTSCPVVEQVTHCATKLRGSELDVFLQLMRFKTCQGLFLPSWLSARRLDGLPPYPKKWHFRSKNESDIWRLNVWPVANFTSVLHTVFTEVFGLKYWLLIKTNSNYTFLQPANINPLISIRFLEISKLIPNIINSTRFKLQIQLLVANFSGSCKVRGNGKIK